MSCCVFSVWIMARTCVRTADSMVASAGNSVGSSIGQGVGNSLGRWVGNMAMQKTGYLIWNQVAVMTGFPYLAPVPAEPIHCLKQLVW